MILFSWLVASALIAQVPPPSSFATQSAALHAEHAAIVEKEATLLKALATAVKASGDTEAAKTILASIAAPTSPDGSTRFFPIPEIVPAPANLAEGEVVPPWRSGMETVRADTAKALFDLAAHAAASSPKRYALADACLREVVARRPDHAEARRLLGQVKFEGGWATPYAAAESRAGKVLHPVFGWVRKGWVPHLEKGELPENGGVAVGSERWIPAMEADSRHGEWSNAWIISTEHFQIKTNVSLAESIAFGRHLETLHEVFESILADVIGDTLPLALRYKSPTLVAEKRGEPHRVNYFADRQEYIDYLRPTQPNIEESLGLYLPPKSPKTKRGEAYFFRDEKGDLPVTATLFHEVSHQLLFESGIAKADAHTNNAGNFWVFEGLGTYFETLQIEPDGTVRIGGLVRARNEEAKKRLVADGALVPLRIFVDYTPKTFNADTLVRRRYQQAGALTTYLMDGQGRKYREGFLVYVRDACRGALRRGSGHSLEERVGIDYKTLETELLGYLK